MTSRPTIKVDLSEWELGEWPEEIGKNRLIVEQHDTGLNISFDFEVAFHNIARKIVTEAIETFFNGEVLHTFTTQGLEISSEELKQKIVVPWDMLGTDGDKETFAQLRALATEEP